MMQTPTRPTGHLASPGKTREPNTWLGGLISVSLAHGAVAKAEDYLDISNWLYYDLHPEGPATCNWPSADG